MIVKTALALMTAILLTACAATPEFVALTEEEKQARINAEGAVKFSTVRRALEGNPQWAMKELVLCEKTKPVGTQIKQIYCRTIELANFEGERTRENLTKAM